MTKRRGILWTVALAGALTAMGCSEAKPPGDDDDDNGFDAGVDYDAGGRPCELDTECDDGIPCTTDSCTAEARCSNVAEDSICDDGQFCNGAELCNATVGCMLGAAPEIDDGVGCTTDACDEIADMVTHTVDDTLCDDGMFCNGPELCDATLDCQPPQPPMVDDGIACTDDNCDEVLDMVVHTPIDALCDDGEFCNGPELCDATLDCQVGVPPVIDDGVTCTVDSCDETLDTVVNAASDALCDDLDDCTIDSCDAVADCANLPDPACFTGTCTEVLVYSDCTNATCTAEPDTSVADDAATFHGLPVTFTTDVTANFEAELATGAYDLVIIESNLNCPPQTMWDAVTAYVNAGGKIMLSFWDLDSNGCTENLVPLKAALDVTTGTDFTSPRQVHSDPAALTDLFAFVETFPSPLVPLDVFNDDGDELTPGASGWLAARHDSTVGPGAIAVTNADTTIVNGFDLFALLQTTPADGDADGIRDAEELYRNEIQLLCAAPAEMILFPDAGDTISPAHGYLWELGAFVEGLRSTALASVTGVDATLIFTENVLTCDTQDMKMVINGIDVGTFIVSGGEFTKTLSFTFPAIAGPDFTLRYENTRMVGSGCGSAKPDMTGAGTVTLTP